MKTITKNDAKEYAAFLDQRLAPSVEPFSDAVEKAFYAGAAYGFNCAVSYQDEKSDMFKLSMVTQMALNSFFETIIEEF